IDECQDESVCTRGHCENTEGAFICHCESGFKLSESGDQCDDVNECQELTGLCDGVGQCVNNIGSYHCNCPPGYRQVNDTHCQDVDECEEETLKLHSVDCVNTEGSFYFICEPGYARTQDPPACEDMNECELLSNVCGEAVCENVPGSFVCVCPEEGFEFNQMTAKCLPAPKASSTERRVCYYNLSDENLCDNVLASSVTIEECCCTLGAGWGDNCEVFPCPVQGSDPFAQMCPAGKGRIPTAENTSPATYKGVMQKVDCFTVNCEPLKATIDDLIQRLFDTMLTALRRSIQGHIQAIDSFVSSGMVMLSTRPESIEEIGDANSKHSQLQAQKPEVLPQFQQMEEKNRLLRSVAGGGVDSISSLRAKWDKFELMMESHQLMIREQ
ncbi:cytoplasmic dynein 2 heavy chain 1 isoform X1, partial [Tachysurus ichikawai]